MSHIPTRRVLFAAALAIFVAQSASSQVQTYFEKGITALVHKNVSFSHQSSSDPLDIWIEKLRYAESQGNDAVIILDSNKKYSYGCLQFQRATFDQYSKKFGIYGDIMDCGTQKELARAMLTYDRNAWRHWYHSTTTKVGKPPVVTS